MEMRQYVKEAKKFLQSGKNRHLHSQVGLLSEAGELLQLYRKMVWNGKKVAEEEIMGELGDMFWYLAIRPNNELIEAEACFTPDEIKPRLSIKGKIEEIIEFIKLRASCYNSAEHLLWLTARLGLGYSIAEILQRNIDKLTARHGARSSKSGPKPKNLNNPEI